MCDHETSAMLTVGSVLLAIIAGLNVAAGATTASSNTGDGVHGALIELSVPSNRSLLRLAAQYTRAGSLRPVEGHLVQVGENTNLLPV